MLQHAIFTVPNCREGYTTDDNARALIFTVLQNQTRSNDWDSRLACRRTQHSAIWRFWSMRLIHRKAASGIF